MSNEPRPAKFERIELPGAVTGPSQRCAKCGTTTGVFRPTLVEGLVVCRGAHKPPDSLVNTAREIQRRLDVLSTEASDLIEDLLERLDDAEPPVEPL